MFMNICERFMHVNILVVFLDVDLDMLQYERELKTD